MTATRKIAARAGLAAGCAFVGLLVGRYPTRAMVVAGVIAAAVAAILVALHRDSGPVLARTAAADFVALPVARKQAIAIAIAAGGLVSIPLVERLGSAGLVPNQLAGLLMIGLAALGVTSLVVAGERYRVGLWAFALVASYVALFAAAGVRNDWTRVAWSQRYAATEIAIWILVFGLAVLVGAATAANRFRDAVSLSVAAGICAVIVANVLLFWMGVRGAAGNDFTGSGSASLLGLLGVQRERALFPLMSSANGMGALAGAGLTTCLIVRSHPRARPIALLRRCSTATAIVCGYVLVLVDARAAILIAAVLPVLLRTGARVRLRLLAAPILLSPVSALLLTKASDFLTGPASSLGLIRAGSADLTTGRVAIWHPVMDFISTHGSGAAFGYGLFGQSVTGVSSLYNSGYYNVNDRPDLLPVHNFALQTVLNVGFVGLALITIGLIVIVRRLARTSDHHVGDAVILGLLVYFACIGWTEAAPTEGNLYLLIPWLITLGVAVARVAARPASRADDTPGLHRIARGGFRRLATPAAGAHRPAHVWRST